MLKKLVLLLLCGSMLAACQAKQDTSKASLGELEQEEQTAVAAVQTNTSAQQEVPQPVLAPAPPEAQGEPAVITWNDFFDNGDQTKPSQKFEELSGKKVVMEGYMGELISMKGGWFLLIEQPGAECPFCSGDQSYWNKIMIVFAKEPNHLRLIPGKVKVTATLDIGAKQDQSGYTTMFRLYHAEFESAE